MNGLRWNGERDVKKQIPYVRKKTQIRLDRIILPEWGDLRSWRDTAFAERLYRDLFKEGLLSLPIVRPCSAKPEFFECLDGWSRVEQLRLLDEKTVECVVIDNIDDRDAVILSLKMNIIRKPHDAIGIARTFKLLHDSHKMKYADIADRFNLTRSWVYKLVRLLSLPKEIQEKVSQGHISIKDGLEMVAGHYSPDVLRPDDKNQVCDFCHNEVAPHLINRNIICYRCSHQLNNLIAQDEAELKAELAIRAKQAKEHQKRLVDD